MPHQILHHASNTVVWSRIKYCGVLEVLEVWSSIGGVEPHQRSHVKITLQDKPTHTHMQTRTLLCVPSGAVAGVGVMVWVLGGCVGAAGALASADDCCSVLQCVVVCWGVLGCAVV